MRSDHLLGGSLQPFVGSEVGSGDGRRVEHPSAPATQQLALLGGAPVGGDPDGVALERLQWHLVHATAGVFRPGYVTTTAARTGAHMHSRAPRANRRWRVTSAQPHV